MAADALGLPPFTIADLAAEVRATAPPDALVLVETAGGVRSPIADDGDSAALIDALGPALVVLVADAGLGTINVVRLSVEALAPHPVVVYLNNFDHGWKLHVRNADWLRTREGLEVVTDIEALTRRVEPLARTRG
jgi:dethiobiotin synthetase